MLWMGASEYVTASTFYIAARDNGAVTLNAGNQYKSLVYLNGKKKSYVLLNDIEKNGESIKKGKLTNIRGVGECDGWVYDLSATTGTIPPRAMVFSNSGKKDHNLALFNISDFDRERNIYATLKLEKDRDKNVRLVWLSVE